jgi:hypothetical protein
MTAICSVEMPISRVAVLLKNDHAFRDTISFKVQAVGVGAGANGSLGLACKDDRHYHLFHIIHAN